MKPAAPTPRRNRPLKNINSIRLDPVHREVEESRLQLSDNTHLGSTQCAPTSRNQLQSSSNRAHLLPVLSLSSSLDSGASQSIRAGIGVSDLKNPHNNQHKSHRHQQISDAGSAHHRHLHHILSQNRSIELSRSLGHSSSVPAALADGWRGGPSSAYAYLPEEGQSSTCDDVGNPQRNILSQHRLAAGLVDSGKVRLRDALFLYSKIEGDELHGEDVDLDHSGEMQWVPIHTDRESFASKYRGGIDGVDDNGEEQEEQSQNDSDLLGILWDVMNGHSAADSTKQGSATAFPSVGLESDSIEQHKAVHSVRPKTSLISTGQVSRFSGVTARKLEFEFESFYRRDHKAELSSLLTSMEDEDT